MFGINGFVIGPLVAALFIAFWGIFIREVHILSPDVEDQEEDNDDADNAAKVQSGQDSAV